MNHISNSLRPLFERGALPNEIELIRPYGGVPAGARFFWDNSLHAYHNADHDAVAWPAKVRGLLQAGLAVVRPSTAIHTRAA